MDVIFDATDLNESSLFSANDTTDVGVKVVLDRKGDRAFSEFRAEDDVVREARVGTHGVVLVREPILSGPAVVPLGLVATFASTSPG